jgi:hypothetical protein
MIHKLTREIGMTVLRPGLRAFLVYTAAALVLTYPLVRELTTIVPSDLGDPLLNAWILWWNAQTVPLTGAWWNAPAFFPSSDALALSEHLFGLSLLTSPVIWLTANTQLAYNLAFLLTFILSASGGYALGFVLTKRTEAAFLAGLAYGFAPYRMDQFPHIQTLASYGMPFALVGLHKYLEDRRARWLALVGGAALVQGLTNGYYLLFFPVLVGLWMLWFRPVARPLAALAAIGGTFAAASLPFGPILLHYERVHEQLGLRRDVGEIAHFSADITALTHGSTNLALWSWLPDPGPEGALFPGLAVVLVAIAGLVWGRREKPAALADRSLRRWLGPIPLSIAGLATVFSLVALSVVIVGPWKVRVLGISISAMRATRPLWQALVCWLAFVGSVPRVRAFLSSRSPMVFYVAATIVMWTLSFGPAPAFRGHEVFQGAPYHWLTLLPGFSGLRVPARFAMLATLTLAAAASLALARLLPRLGRRGQVALVAAATAGVLADGWLRQMPLEQPPPPSIVTPGAAPGAVLELPLGEPMHDVVTMYRGTAHGHPVVNGFSGYAPPAYDTLRFALELGDQTVLAELASRGVRHVVVNVDRDPKGFWQNYVAGYPGARLVRSDAGQRHYELPGVARTAEPQAAGGLLPVARVEASVWPEDVAKLADGDLETRWSSGGPQGRERETLLIDLGAVREVGGVELALGSFRADFPRRLLIERSLDGEGWADVRDGGTGGLAVAGALEDPQRLPIRVRFAPVQARYLRLRQLGEDPVFYWSVAELAVFGRNGP